MSTLLIWNIRFTIQEKILSILVTECMFGRGGKRMRGMKTVGGKKKIVDGMESYFPLSCLVKREERKSFYFSLLGIRGKMENIKNIWVQNY